MKFHNHETVYEAVQKDPNSSHVQVGGWREFYDAMIKHFTRSGPVIQTTLDMDWQSQALTVCGVEKIWYGQSRPYYKVWPSILDSLLSFNLDVKITDIRIKPRVFAVRFGDGFEIVSDKCVCTSFLAGIIGVPTTAGEVFQMLVVFPIVCREGVRIWDGMHLWTLLVNSTPGFPNENATFSDSIANVNQLFKKADTYLGEATIRTSIIKIALMIHMMADDPTVIQPDVLAKDRYRFDNSTDPELRQRLIDKAKRRGAVGWRIGEQYETIPHYRRPHPALYHVGKGRKEQRVVFRAGSVVHRQKLTEVPTGYMDDDGREIER